MTGADREMIERYARTFPATFGLKAFPGDVFRVSLSNSYVNWDNGLGTVMLYLDIRKGNGWYSFAKGTVEELRGQVVKGGRL